MPQADGWERFWRNDDNKNNFIALFVKFLKRPESEKYRRYIVWYFIIYIYDYVRTFAYRLKIIWFIVWCVSRSGTSFLSKKRKHLRKSVTF